MYYRCIKPNMEIPTVLYNATMHHFLNCWINSPLISVWEKFKFCTLNDVTSSSKRILGLKQNQSFECMYVSRYIHQVISWNKDLCKFNLKSKTTIKNISIFYSSYLFQFEFNLWLKDYCLQKPSQQGKKLISRCDFGQLLLNSKLVTQSCSENLICYPV